MEIEYGSQVVDKNDKVLGTVQYVIRDTWTGDISKFMVRNRELDSSAFKDFFVQPQNVLQAGDSGIKLNVSFEELSKNE